ncbi:MAG: type I-C CRISPR-associated endonuclease Cas1 [Legionellales bacterium]|nr:type I-C CRISPR-associated endonuclease Cas1 [Legionellales bacterium]
MKKLLNTLYITRQDTYLHKERETIIIKQGDQKLGQFPALTVGNIVCFGQVTVSPPLMGYCGEQGIAISYYTEQGKFLARIYGRQVGNVLLRRTQYRFADDQQKVISLAKLIVGAKIANSRYVYLRQIRNHGESSSLQLISDRLANCLSRCEQVNDYQQLLGLEGEAALAYFSGLNELIRNNEFSFSTRVRRPPTDPINALLSFVYSIITQECLSALLGVGLDPFVGFLHKERPGRPSLALDLLEEFRAAWADRFVLTLINRKQLTSKDFVQEASGAVHLTDYARKTLFAAYQARKQEEIIHPYLQERVQIGLLPHCQALLLARYMRGDLEYYPPYLVK